MFAILPNNALISSQTNVTPDNPLGNLKGKPSTSSGSGSSGSSGSPTDYSFLEYLEGLFASQGAENEVNRQFNSAEAALNREFQSSEAQIQRDFYEALSSSAYQRAVKDMKAAGLNPALAYQQGGAASSGTGVAAGSAAAYTATGGDSLSSLLIGFSELISALTGASASKIETAFKIFRMAGGK